MKNNSELREEKFAMIRRWQESGLSQIKFSEQENISYATFNYWIKQYRAKNNVDVGKGFIKLQSHSKNVGSENIFSEIIFSNGNTIRLFNALDISELKKLAS